MEKQTNKQNKKMITWPPSHWMKPARIQGVMYICFRYGSINMKWQIESDVHLSDLFVAENIHVMYSSLSNLQSSTVFPWIIAGGKYFFFRTKRERLFEGHDYFKYFRQRGAINCLTAIIRGNTVTLNQYFGVFFDSNVFLEFKSNSKKEIYSNMALITLSKSLVSTLLLIPSVLLVPFLLSFT